MWIPYSHMWLVITVICIWTFVAFLCATTEKTVMLKLPKSLYVESMGCMQFWKVNKGITQNTIQRDEGYALRLLKHDYSHEYLSLF